MLMVNFFPFQHRTIKFLVHIALLNRIHSKYHTLMTIQYLSNQKLVVSDYQCDQHCQDRHLPFKKSFLLSINGNLFLSVGVHLTILLVSSLPFTSASQQEYAKSIAQWLSQKYVEIEKEHKYEYRSITSVGPIVNTDIVCTFEIELYCQPILGRMHASFKTVILVESNLLRSSQAGSNPHSSSHKISQRNVNDLNSCTKQQ